MRTKKFLQWPVIAGLAILSGVFFIVSCTSTGKNQVSSDNNAENLTDKSNNNIKKTVKAADIQNALVKSKSKKIVLNIYPVKLSNSPKKNDFDLLILFQDAGEVNKNLGKDVSSKIFETQSASYVSFLKDKKLPRSKIPFGYYIEINSALMKDARDVKICIDPDQALMKYCLQPEDKKPEPAKEEDCCITAIRQYGDSIGKCPPCLIIYKSLLLQKPMEGVIEKAYGMTK
jgi:hypothetical protein